MTVDELIRLIHAYADAIDADDAGLCRVEMEAAVRKLASDAEAWRMVERMPVDMALRHYNEAGTSGDWDVIEKPHEPLVIVLGEELQP